MSKRSISDSSVERQQGQGQTPLVSLNDDEENLDQEDFEILASTFDYNNNTGKKDEQDENENKRSLHGINWTRPDGNVISVKVSGKTRHIVNQLMASVNAIDKEIQKAVLCNNDLLDFKELILERIEFTNRIETMLKKKEEKVLFIEE